MFYFDSSFRPVPLEQHFIGVRGKLGSPQFRRNLERVTFEKVADLVKEGHQVMVFVHSRKDTVHTAQGLKEAALAEGCLEDFSCEEHPTYSFFRSELARSRNKEMKELFEFGFGIHHAGMLREDRTRMERLFEARVIKVWSQIELSMWPGSIVYAGSLLYSHPRMGGQLTCTRWYVGYWLALPQCKLTPHKLLSRVPKFMTVQGERSQIFQFSMCCRSSVGLDAREWRVVVSGSFVPRMINITTISMRLLLR